MLSAPWLRIFNAEKEIKRINANGILWENRIRVCWFLDEFQKNTRIGSTEYRELRQL